MRNFLCRPDVLLKYAFIQTCKRKSNAKKYRMSFDHQPGSGIKKNES